MCSKIARKESLTNVFESDANIVDVYSEHEFDFSDTCPTFVVLAKKSVDTVKMLFSIQDVYNNPVKLYVIYNNMSTALAGYKIIWRKGKWLV